MDQIEQLKSAGGAVRQMFQMVVDSLDIDADTTVLKVSAEGKELAEISIGEVFRRWDEAAK